MRQLAAIVIAKAQKLGADTGQDLVEYALLAALISIFCASAVTTLGSQVNTVLWQTIASNF
jgi:Flp pilus assembly pilin Flp